MKHYDYIESEDLYELALEWIKRKNTEKAELYLRRVISLNPRFIYAYITMARLYGRKKNFSMAISTIKKARNQDPDFDRLDYLLAKYAYKAGDYRLALRYIDGALAKAGQPLYIKSRSIILKAVQGLDFNTRLKQK